MVRVATRNDHGGVPLNKSFDTADTSSMYSDDVMSKHVGTVWSVEEGNEEEDSSVDSGTTSPSTLKVEPTTSFDLSTQASRSTTMQTEYSPSFDLFLDDASDSNKTADAEDSEELANCGAKGDELASSLSAYYNNILAMKNYVSMWREDKPFDEESLRRSEDGDLCDAAYGHGSGATQEMVVPPLPMLGEYGDLLPPHDSMVSASTTSPEGKSSSRNLTANSKQSPRAPGETRELDGVYCMNRDYNEEEEDNKKRRRLIMGWCCCIVTFALILAAILTTALDQRGATAVALTAAETRAPASPPVSPSPTKFPSPSPSASLRPTSGPSKTPSPTSSFQPTMSPSSSPYTAPPTSAPATAPNDPTANNPTIDPVPLPTRSPLQPTVPPLTKDPTSSPVEQSTPQPIETTVPTQPPVTTSQPSPQPSRAPITSSPTAPPTVPPTPLPTPDPVPPPTPIPTLAPVSSPTPLPTMYPTTSPTTNPTECRSTIVVDKGCYVEGDDTLVVDFFSCDPLQDDWIGFYVDDADPQNLEGNYIAWAWACGDQTCNEATESNTFGIDTTDLALGTFRAFLSRDNPSGAPYQAVAFSDVFEISNNCP